MIQKVKGTQDFLDLTFYNEIVSRMRFHLSRYNFVEIQTPLLQHVSLFTRGLGTHTDVVSKEMFIIKSRDEEETDPICLRPEETASTMRAFLENHIEKVPWKVFLIGPMFRYERPQKGRLRQFHQCNIEVIGEPSITGDVELLVMLDRFFHEQLHMNNYSVHINFLGCPEDRKKHHKLLYDFVKDLEQSLLCTDCVIRVEHNLLRIFDCKRETCQALYKKAPKTTDALCTECAQEWEFLKTTLSALSVSVFHNPFLVRGLDYYTKTVFEFVGHHGVGSQSTFCGGGRYDQLAQVLESKQSYPSFGAAIGIERLLLMLDPYKDKISVAKQPLVMILPYEQEQHILALLYADEIRARGISCEILFEGSVKSKMRRADKANCALLLFIGSSEQESQTVMIKHMKTGDQEKVKMADVVEYIVGKVS